VASSILMPMSGNPSLYIHVPFCTQKCGYCHFFVLPFKQDSVKTYLQALKQEIALKKPHFPQTIYFGGGTPSLLPPQTIAEILSYIPHDPQIEITLEVNPEEATPALMREFAFSGINRVSIGVQSLDDHLLCELTRKHDAKKAIEAITATHEAGIHNISIDLIYDIPSQTTLSWERTLERVENLPIQHLSLYNLTIEPHTSFYQRRKELERKVPLPEESLVMLEEAVKRLEGYGLKRYEISAFARPGFESKHNTGYWTGRPFHGLGPSAFGYINGTRGRNVANLKKYAEELQSGRSPHDFEETLSEEAKNKELLSIGLRLLQGVKLKDFSISEETKKEISKLIDDQLLISSQGQLKLTPRGLLFYDDVATSLI
jgi:oxygen-independent coproporphyrinogen-3 oxidase